MNREQKFEAFVIGALLIAAWVFYMVYLDPWVFK